MKKLFNHILVPVDFSTVSEAAVEKAAAIAIQCKCHIHLLHVMPIVASGAMISAEGIFFTPPVLTEERKMFEQKLEQFTIRLKNRISQHIDINHIVQYGEWTESIINTVKQLHIDLVLIGQKKILQSKRKMFINPNEIASETNIPVITVPSNRRLTKLYSVAIPITDFLPLRKIKYGIYIASAYKTTIKLVGIQNEKTEDQLEFFMNKADEYIRTYHIGVESVILKNDNIAEAVNTFVEKNSVDLVILNPGKQTRMPGFLSALSGKSIQKCTTSPVLTVNPA